MSENKTCFKKVDYTLSGLLHAIDIGDIGLPDIQRPFVWPNTRVRDLFDSMFRGFPVGYLLFWENSQVNGAKQIGTDPKGHPVPLRLIVDGQQRLTSLYAVIRGKKVVDSEYRERNIEIAFRPRYGKFDVCDAAIRKDPEWIPNISVLWSSSKSSYQLVKEFLQSLEKAKGQLSEKEEEQISHNLDRVFDLERHHLFPRGWLEKNGILDIRLVNQQANFALLEWPENIDIGDKPPYEYIPNLRARFKDEEWKTMLELHALPLGWENMPYEDFLSERRKRMAQVIRWGFELLA